MDDLDRSILIPVFPLLEELQCPICFDYIKLPVETPCGHLFCSTCLSECLNNKSVCPVCNAKCRAADTHNASALRRIQEKLNGLKEESLKGQMERLFIAEEGSRPLRPIEALLQRELKRSVAEYDNYYQDMQKRHASRLESMKKRGASVKELHEEEENYEKRTKYLLESYEKHLKAALPPPANLPVVLEVYVATRDLILIPTLSVRPQDTLKEIRAIVEAAFVDKGDPIIAWQPHNIFLLEDGDAPEGKEAELSRIVHDDLPLSLLNPRHGGRLVLVGALKTSSTIPPSCFKSVWNQNQAQPAAAPLVEDYFTCKSCKLNWICANCAKSCHSKLGHEIQVYLQAHKPSWGCCYCSKSGLCCLSRD